MIDLLLRVEQTAAGDSANSLALKIRNWVTPVSDLDNILAVRRWGGVVTYSNSPTFSSEYIDMNGAYLRGEITRLSPEDNVIAIRFDEGIFRTASMANQYDLFWSWQGATEYMGADVPPPTASPSGCLGSLLRYLLQLLGLSRERRIGPAPKDISIDHLLERIPDTRGIPLPSLYHFIRDEWLRQDGTIADHLLPIPRVTEDELLNAIGPGTVTSVEGRLFLNLLLLDKDMAKQFIDIPEACLDEFQQGFQVHVPEDQGLIQVIKTSSRVPALLTY